jgi:hypothetical protein
VTARLQHGDGDGEGGLLRAPKQSLTDPPPGPYRRLAPFASGVSLQKSETAGERPDVRAAHRFLWRRTFQMRKLDARFAPILFGLLLSGLMSLIVSGIATWRAVGFIAGFPTLWALAWAPSWAVAFPAVLVVAPAVRKIVAAVCAPPAR